MMSESDYLTEQEYKQYQEIMNTKEYLTQEEYDFCFNWDHEETRTSTSKLSEGRYLNLNVYSEAEKEDYDFRRETGL